MNLVKRILVAIVAIPVMLFLFYKGGLFLLSFLSLLSIFLSYELILIFKKKSIEIPILTVLFSVIFLILFSLKLFEYSFYFLFLQVILVAGRDIFSNRLEGALNRISSSVFVLFYSSFLLSFLYYLNAIDRYLPILLIVLIWITDTGAYFIGMTLGKHRGFVSASPNKSIEGFFGGLVFAFVFAILFAKIFSFIDIKMSLFAALSSGIFGQFGDLVESMIKRDAKIKDSSAIIPGHGGVLDRFDSLLFAAPAFYILVKLFG